MPEYLADILSSSPRPMPRPKQIRPEPRPALRASPDVDVSKFGGFPQGAGAPWSVVPGSLAGAEGGFTADGLPTFDLLEQIRMVESGGNDQAVSPVGAQGPYQIMPHTAADPGYGLPSISPDDVWNRDASRRWAAGYLREMFRKYQNPMLAVAAYNAGPGRIDEILADGGGFAQFPAETQGYVRKVGVFP